MKGQVDFSNGKILQNMVYSALPMLAAQFLNLLYSIVDRIYIGQIPGEGVAALGGIGLCFPIVSLITGFANLFGAGGAPLCSIARGQQNQQEASQILNNSFYMLAGTALGLTLIGFFQARPILVLFGASGASLPYAYTYLRIYILGTIPFMISLGMNPFINAQGFARTGMVSVFLGALLNLILDPVLIFGLHMDIQGAAIATVVSQSASAVYVLVFLTGSRAELKILPLAQVKWKARSVTDILSLGFAGFIMQVTNSLVQIACNSTLGQYGGDLYISVMTIINSIRQILDTPVISLSDGTSPIIGYNYGAGNYAGVKKAIRLMTWAGMAYTMVVWAVILLWPRVLIGIFNREETFFQAAVPAARIYFSSFIFQTLQFAGQSVFKSLNKKKQAIFFSLLRKVVIVVPLTLLLPRIGFGVMGVFLAEPVSNILGGLACFMTMYWTVYQKMPDTGVKKQAAAESGKDFF